MLPFLGPHLEEWCQMGMPGVHVEDFSRTPSGLSLSLRPLGSELTPAGGIVLLSPCRGTACLGPASRPEVIPFSLADAGVRKDLWASIFILCWLTLFET